jgi:hypothetical protein
MVIWRIGLAVRGQRTADDHRTVWGSAHAPRPHQHDRSQTRSPWTHRRGPPCRPPVRAGPAPPCRSPRCPQREDAFSSGSTVHHVEGLKRTGATSWTTDRPTVERATICRSHPPGRTSSSLPVKITGLSGLARIWPAVESLMPAGTGRQDPPGIDENVFLPRARDSDHNDALPDGQAVYAAAEFVDYTDGFDAGHGPHRSP